MNILNTILSFVVGIAGGYMLVRGKKTQNISLMVWGGVLIVASYWLFP